MLLRLNVSVSAAAGTCAGDQLAAVDAAPPATFAQFRMDAPAIPVESARPAEVLRVIARVERTKQRIIFPSSCGTRGKQQQPRRRERSAIADPGLSHPIGLLIQYQPLPHVWTPA